MRFLAVVVVLLLLTACDADKWAIKSNPSGSAQNPDGGIVIVVVKSTLPPSQDTTPGPTGVEGEPAEEVDPVQIYLLTGVSDADLGDGDRVIHGRSLVPLETAR